jgi:hypothetical protein
MPGISDKKAQSVKRAAQKLKTYDANKSKIRLWRTDTEPTERQ